MAPVVFRTLDELRAHSHAIAGAYILEKAWQRMKLDAVVCSGSKPLIYVKTVLHYDRKLEARLHKELWNQDLAPVLLVLDPLRVRVYSARPLVEPSSDAPRYIEAIDTAAHALEAGYLVDRMQSGEYFSIRSQHFSRQFAVDRSLLNNLTSTRDALHDLDQRVSHDRLHRLLICTIFLRYLMDRGVLRSEYLSRRTRQRRCESLTHFIEEHPSGKKHAFSEAFRIIGDDLGGDLLAETAKELEDGPLREVHFELLLDFLKGVTNGQLPLNPKWAYDLSFIPTETVSAIYQEFLSVEVEDAKRKLGTVATPKHLAEMMVDLSITPDLFQGNGKILDPACGSGVFLVTVFNRLAFAHRIANPLILGIDVARSLTEILKDRIFGVDINATSCHLTALNLVHSLLSHLQDEELFKVLIHRERLVPPLFLTVSRMSSNIQCGDFLRFSTAPEYQLVIGNPPWSKDVNPVIDQSLNELGKIVPKRGNLAHHFALRAPSFLCQGGLCCLLLDAKAMLASANGEKFIKQWFQTFRVESIVNLTNLRSFLFDNAGRAGAIFSVRNEIPRPEQVVRYRVPLPARSTKQLGILDAAPCTSFEVPYADVLRADTDLLRLWKVRQWGTPRDIRFVERLSTHPKLIDFLRDRGGELHQGFNIHGSSGEYAEQSLLARIPYLPSNRKASGDWSLVLPAKLFTRKYGEVEREQSSIRQWVSNEGKIFGGVRLVIHHSATSANPPGIRAAVTKDSFSFHKEILGLYFDNLRLEDECSLYALAGILSSSVVAYYLFHTSPTWGVESQPQVRVKKDLWALPIPDLSAAPARALSQLIRELGVSVEHSTLADYSRLVAHRQDKVEELVRAAYDVDSTEAFLLEHFLTVTAPSSDFSEERESTLDATATSTARANYCDILAENIFLWSGRRSGLQVQAVLSFETGLCLVEIKLLAGAGGIKVNREIVGGDAFSSSMRRVMMALRSRERVLPSYRNLLMFDGPSLFFTRPLLARFWTSAWALNDADFICSYIFSGQVQ